MFLASHRKRILVWLFFISSIGLAGFYFSKNDLNTKSQILATLSDSDYSAVKLSGSHITPFFASNGRSVYYIIKRGSKSAVFIKNTEGKWYDEIDYLTVSSTGNHYAYYAISDGENYLIRDGVESTAPGVIKNIELSSNGGHILYTFHDKILHQDAVSFDGKVGGFYDDIFFESLNSAGNTVYYYGCKDYACSFITQDAQGKTNSQYAYMWQRRVIGEKRSTESSLTMLEHGIITWNPRGNIVAYVSRSNGADSLVVNGSAQFAALPKPYKKITINEVVFSHDGNHLAYIVQGCEEFMNCNRLAPDGTTYLVSDSVVNTASYDGVRRITYSNDGSILAFFAKRDAKWFLVVNNKESRLPDDTKEPSEITFSPIDNSVAYSYVNTDGNVALVRNDKKIAEHKVIARPEFAPTNGLLFVATEDYKTIQIASENHAGTFFDTIVPFTLRNKSLMGITNDPEKSNLYTFTPDGKNVVYGAVDGRNFLWVVQPI